MKLTTIVVLAVSALALVSVTSLVSATYAGTANTEGYGPADDDLDQTGQWMHQRHHKWSDAEGDQPWRHCEDYSYAYQNDIEDSAQGVCDTPYTYSYDYSYEHCDSEG